MGVVAATATAVVLAVLLWGRFVESVLFQPTAGAQIPATLPTDVEEVFLTSSGGVRIHAFHLPADQASRAILFLHGNGGNASHRLPRAFDLAALGTQVMLLEYRGYGRSDGTPTESGVVADARAGLAHLVDARGLPPERIVVLGRSLGGAVAVQLAAGRELAGLILESTFTSVEDVARNAFGPLAFLVGDRFPSDARIGEIRAPLLFFHGDRDDIVPWELGRRLFELAPEPKAFETLAGAGHNDTALVGGRPYLERIRRFLDEVAPEAPDLESANH